MADIGFFSRKTIASAFLDGENGFNDGRRSLFRWGTSFVVVVFHGGDGLCLEQRDTYMEMTNVLSWVWPRLGLGLVRQGFCEMEEVRYTYPQAKQLGNPLTN